MNLLPLWNAKDRSYLSRMARLSLAASRPGFRLRPATKRAVVLVSRQCVISTSVQLSTNTFLDSI